MPRFRISQATQSHRATLLGLIKEAELGGVGNDVEFEQAFSNLAHSYLRDKAPSLQQYEVGFQLLDRNEDGNKAVGIFGFKVGTQWLYAPVFFLAGDLKGHELLYIKDQDQFVPLKENWLNQILQRKPNILGHGVDRNLSSLGITPPNLQLMQQSPTKVGSAIRPDLIPGAAAFAYFASTDPNSDPKYTALPDLKSFLKKEGAVAIRALIRELHAFPKVAEAFAETFDGLSVLREAVESTRRETLSGVLGEKSAASTSIPVTAKKLAPRPKPKAGMGVLADSTPEAAPKLANLRIVTLDSFDPKSDLSARDREILLRDGFVVFDKRAEDEVSTAYSTSTLKLTNPTETGIYDVLVKPGSFERCLVMFAPHSHLQKHTFATVVRLDGQKNWTNAHPSYLWVRQKSETNGADYQSWLDTLPEAKTLSPSHSGLYMLVGPRAQGSCPFRVNSEVAAGDGVKVYDCRFRDYARYDRPGHLPPIAQASRGMAYDGGPGYEERIQLTGKVGSRMRCSAGDLYIPAGFKLLTILSDTDAQDEEGSGVLCGCSGLSDQSEPPPIVLGSNVDLDRAIFDKTASLKICHSGTEVRIGDLSLSPLAGFVHLVRDVGLRVKQAKAVLREAEQKKVLRVRIKRAAQEWPLTQSAPGAPGITEPSPTSDPMVPNGTSQPSFEQLQNVGLEKGQKAPIMPAPDPQTQQVALDAAQNGQKEVFDATMIGSVLNAVHDDTMIDQNIGPLMQGLDKLGRILFSFYWHGDKFQDRYGKEDMPDLEDGLRNAFEHLGDVVLALKQKTIEPFPDEMAHADLSHAAA